tara:strand:- start:59 stop:580 length:522 start_codon:yes stop_codon:yes gene_type:complete
MQEENIKDLTEDVAITKHWQWIKGDLSGNVVTFKNEGPQWITFNEGGRIATDLRDEFLQQLDPDIAGEFIKPNPAMIDPLNIPVLPMVNAKQTSPIRVLFDKQKKNDKVKLTLQFPVNIPPNGIFNLMSSSFDADEVRDELQSFILDQLSEDEILDCLHSSVQSLIESKYKDK